jgi:hypothetical protein
LVASSPEILTRVKKVAIILIQEIAAQLVSFAFCSGSISTYMIWEFHFSTYCIFHKVAYHFHKLE